MFALPTARYDLLDGASALMARIDDDVRAAALQAFMSEFEARYQRRMTLRPPDLDARIAHGDSLLAALQQDGCALAALPGAAKSRLLQRLAPLAAEAEAKLESQPKPSFSDGQVALERDRWADAYEGVSQALVESGALAALGAYAGRPLALLRLTLQVNTERETRSTWGELDASGLPQRRTRYWHVDSNDWPGVKALVYLSDVDADGGPFRYVFGSHKLMGPYEAAVRKTNDKLRYPRLKLMALPREFAQHASFGDHIDPDAPESLRLLEQERTLCDGRSDLVLFDNNGVHRGGMVRRGRRHMLQCLFCAADKRAPG